MYMYTLGRFNVIVHLLDECGYPIVVKDLSAASTVPLCALHYAISAGLSFLCTVPAIISLASGFFVASTCATGFFAVS